MSHWLSEGAGLVRTVSFSHCGNERADHGLSPQCPSLRSSQGLVVVWELQLERRGRPERVSVSWEHRGQAISALCWDTSALRVFVGDTTGRVTFLRAGSSKLGKVVSVSSVVSFSLVSAGLFLWR